MGKKPKDRDPVRQIPRAVPLLSGVRLNWLAAGGVLASIGYFLLGRGDLMGRNLPARLAPWVLLAAYGTALLSIVSSLLFLRDPQQAAPAPPPTDQ